MRIHGYCVASASAVVMLAVGSAAVAQSQSMPSLEFVSTSIALGIGGQSGKGVLKLPNLAKGCEIPFTVKGFGAGLKVGISKLTAIGVVKNLTNIADLPGKYVATQAETTVIVGGGVLNLKNQANNVAMELKSTTQGVNVGVGAEGITIKLQKMPTEAPRDWVVHFGFNKHWVGKVVYDAIGSMSRRIDMTVVIGRQGSIPSSGVGSWQIFRPNERWHSGVTCPPEWYY